MEEIFSRTQNVVNYSSDSVNLIKDQGYILSGKKKKKKEKGKRYMLIIDATHPCLYELALLVTPN